MDLKQDIYVEDQPLDHLRLVCSSAHCTATKLDINGKKHLVHKTVCVEPYIFKNRARQFFMNPEFAEADCMNEDGKCKKCGCAWTMHMAIDYKTVEKKKSTDKETTPVEEDEMYEYEEPTFYEVTVDSQGDFNIRVRNFNDNSEVPRKKLGRTQSHCYSKHSAKKISEELKRRAEKRATSEEPPAKATDTDLPVIAEVEVEEKKEIPKKVKGTSKRHGRSKATGIEKNQLPTVVEEGRKDEEGTKKKERSKTLKVEEDSQGVDVEIMKHEAPQTYIETSKDLPPSSTSLPLTKEENAPKRGFFKFKTSVITSGDLPNKPSARIINFKTVDVDTAQLPGSQSPEEPKSPTEPTSKPRRLSLKFKLFGGNSDSKKSPEPTKKKHSECSTGSSGKKQEEAFDEISEVLRSKAEDYIPSHRLLRFSDIIDIIDKQEKQEKQEQEEQQEQQREREIEEHKDEGYSDSPLNDDASTVYTNVPDTHSVNEIKVNTSSKQQSNQQNSGTLKTERNRPKPIKPTNSEEKLRVDEAVARIDKEVQKLKEKLEHTKGVRPKAKIAKFGQGDDLTIASSTMTRTSKPQRLMVGGGASGKVNGYIKSDPRQNDDDFTEMQRELRCEEGDIGSLGEDQMDTRSEKCRRWLVSNRVMSSRPEKFLQRLKKFFVGDGNRFKERLGRNQRVK